MDKKLANRVLSTLDKTAKDLESLVEEKKIDPKVASQMIKNIDTFADRFEVAAFGEKNLVTRKAKVLQRDPDEKFMETFDNPQKPIKTDPDEPYMHDTGPTWSGKGMKTYDSDDTSQVIDRKEYNVRDVSEWADGTKKQPTWESGPAGKSTHQGAKKPVSKPKLKPAEKTWA